MMESKNVRVSRGGVLVGATQSVRDRPYKMHAGGYEAGHTKSPGTKRNTDFTG
jgi:hypothetical protein